MNKRYLILVNSQINLLFAIQLKKTLYAGEKFDLALSSLAPGLKEISERQEIREYFQNIYYIDYSSVSQKIKFSSLLCPRRFFELMTGESFVEYTDIFFWNPTIFLYFYIYEIERRRKEICLHIYGDAISAYICDEPITRKMFNTRFANAFFHLRYHFQPIKQYLYDFYVMGKEYISFDTTRQIINVPIYNIHDNDFMKYINKVFNFDVKLSNDFKYLFMDVVHKEKLGNPDLGIKYLKAVADVVPAEEFAIRPHPRQDLNVYESFNNPNIINFSSPWELYCLNNDISGKVIITSGSGSAFLPFIYTNSIYSVICIDSPNTFNTLYKKEWYSFVAKLKQKGLHIYLVYSPEELENTIRKIQDNGKR